MKIRKHKSTKDMGTICLILLIVSGFLLFLICYKSQILLSNEEATIDVFLKHALQPVGSTMYVWGGGWNESDDKAGGTSTQIGLNPKWKVFYEQQDCNYNFDLHRYERENGLDCSGYVGWVVYNTFETVDGKEGYVTSSTNMAEDFAKRGWGTLIRNSNQFLAGDVVSMEGHVWICLGTCEDGSVLLVHSSPPGVSVCGTSLKGKESIAIQIATEYMDTYHSQWQKRYPNREVPISYMKDVTVFRWSEKVMSDAVYMQSLHGEEILNLEKEISKN